MSKSGTPFVKTIGLWTLPEDFLPEPLKEEHTAVRKPSPAQQFGGLWLLAWSEKLMGEIGCGHLVEYHLGVTVEKTATDIINFCSLQNSKKISSLKKIRITKHDQ